MRKIVVLLLISFGICFAQLETALESIGVKNIYVADTSKGVAAYGDFPGSFTYSTAKDRLEEMLINERGLVTPGIFYSVSLTVNPNVAGRANLWLRIFEDGRVSITKTPYKRSSAGVAGSIRKDGCTSSSSADGGAG